MADQAAIVEQLDPRGIQQRQERLIDLALRLLGALWIVGDRYTSGRYDEYVTSGPVVTVQPSIEDGGIQ